MLFVQEIFLIVLVELEKNHNIFISSLNFHIGKIRETQEIQKDNNILFLVVLEEGLNFHFQGLLFVQIAMKNLVHQTMADTAQNT